MLPLLGPSTPRSAISMGLNFVFDPVYWGTVNDANIHDKATYSLAIAYGVVVMEQNMDLLKDLERSSVDYYAAMKATYMQNRKNKGCFKNDSSANDYDFDFGIEE